MSHSNVPRIPRSSRAKARLVHYFALVGLPEDVAIKKKMFARRDSGAQLSPIDDVMVITQGEEIPSGYEVIEVTPDGRSADLSFGALMQSKSMFIAVSRSDKKKAMTGIDILNAKDHSKPRMGFAQAAKGIIRKGMSLLIEKHPQKDPIISIIVIDLDSGETCPKDYVHIPIELNSGAFGSHRFRMCYRTSNVQRIAFDPKVLDRFPVKNHADYKFPPIITEFCFPGAIRCTSEVHLPRYFSFVFTDDSGMKNYGFALEFYEPLTSNQLKVLEVKNESLISSKGPLYAPKCLVLLSNWPYYEPFKIFLSQVHRIVMSPSYIPFERYLESIMYSVPVPHPASMVKYRIGHKTMEFVMPPLFNYPVQNVDLQHLFKSLDIPKIVSIFEAMLLENKIILYSNHLGVLNPIAESLRLLLFPFEWHAVYIPVLPMLLCNAIQAPFPFLVGMHRSFFDEIRVSDEVTLVDLDRNHIRYGVRQEDPIIHRILPENMRESLISELSNHSNIYQKEDFSSENSDQVSSIHAPVPDDYDEERHFNPEMIRLTFLKFFVSILENYSMFLHPGKVCSFLPPSKGHEDSFFGENFLRSVPLANLDMMKKIISTQYFTQFIQDRVSDDIPFECIFFDFCVAWYKWDANEFPSKILASTNLNTLIPQRNIHAIPSIEAAINELNESNKNKLFENSTFPFINSQNFLIPDRPPIEDKNYIVIFHDLFPENIVSALDETWKNIAIILIDQNSKRRSSNNEKLRTRVSHWGYELMLRVYEIWFAFFLENSSTKCKATACKDKMYKDFSLALIMLHRMLVNGYHATEDIFFAFAKFCMATNLIYMFKKIYGLLQISEVNLTPEFCNTLLEAHLRTASFTSHRCTCGFIKKSSQVSALELKALMPDNLEYFTRTDPRLPVEMYTSATCSYCGYSLSGEEIVAGWFPTNFVTESSSSFISGDTHCPACNTNIGPELKMVHKTEDSKDFFSNIPLIRPHVLKGVLLKELKFLSIGSSPLLNVRLNPALYWNMVWWFSMLNLPYQSILGLVDRPSQRIPVRFKTPLHEDWKVQFHFNGSGEMKSSAPDIMSAVTTKLPKELLDNVSLSLKEGKIETACSHFYSERTKDRAGSNRILQKSLYRCLGLLNKKYKAADPYEFSRKFTSALRLESFSFTHELYQRDYLQDEPTVEKICEVAELIKQARIRLCQYEDPEYVSTLLGLYMDMSIDVSEEAKSSTSAEKELLHEIAESPKV